MSVKSSPIGFFDSGVGGLSVYSKFRKLIEGENTIYFGDLKNLPYGNKSRSELIGFADKILQFFSKKGVKAVVIACNTSSALAYDYIKDNYDFKIYPIIQTCAKAFAQSGLKRIGVFATESTVKSGAYTKEIFKLNPNIEIKEISCPSWVSIVEGVYANNNYESEIKSKVFEMMKFNPEKIILGCTHYPYLMSQLSRYAPQDIFIDPSEVFVECVKTDMEALNLLNPSQTKGTEEFYVSANPESFVKNAELFYKLKTPPTLIDFEPAAC